MAEPTTTPSAVDAGLGGLFGCRHPDADAHRAVGDALRTILATSPALAASAARSPVTPMTPTP